MKPEQIEWQNAEAQKYLTEQGGSKSGAHAFLFDKHPELRQHLPTNTHYIAPGEDAESTIAKMDFSKPKIVRGCHPLDVTGMVDVIPTKVNVRGWRAVREAIQTVLRDAQSEDVRGFAEYESGKPFDGKIGILVQDYKYGWDRGSIVEHPHERGVYRICFNKRPDFGADRLLLEEICTEDGRALNQSRHFDGKYKEKWNMCFSIEQARRVIELYRKIFETGLMPASHSHQMEFGSYYEEDILFYQSRIFRRFEESSGLDVDKIERRRGQKYSFTGLYNAYGITPAEGWELPLAELDGDFVTKYACETQMAYAHNNYANIGVVPLSVRPKNLAVYLPYDHENILEHGYFKWMQKAPVSLIGARRCLSLSALIQGATDREKLQRIDEKMHIRVFSNGIQGLAVVVE